MYSVYQSYRTGESHSRLDKHLGTFDDTNAAKAFAIAIFADLTSIPESERVEVSIIDSKGAVVYVLPEGRLAPRI